MLSIGSSGPANLYGLPAQNRICGNVLSGIDCNGLGHKFIIHEHYCGATMWGGLISKLAPIAMMTI